MISNIDYEVKKTKNKLKGLQGGEAPLHTQTLAKQKIVNEK